MYRRVSHFLFPDPIMWVMFVFTGVALVVWAWLADFTITYGASYEIFYLAIAAFVLGLIYHKRSPGLATFCFSLAFFKFMATVLRPISYLGVAEGFPRLDGKFAAFDQLIGFDWIGHVAWVNNHVWAEKTLGWAYASINPQAMLIFLLFFLTANYERLREFIMVFFGMAFVTTFIATFTPAAGAFFHYQPDASLIANLTPETGRYFQEHFLAVYSGVMRSLDISDSVGLIAFPSFHVQSALLFTWAMRRTKVFWLFAGLNTLMIVSTITFGGHYIIDLVAGAAVFVMVAYAYGLWTGRYRLSIKHMRVKGVAQATGFKVQLPLWEFFQKRRSEKSGQGHSRARLN